MGDRIQLQSDKHSDGYGSKNIWKIMSVKFNLDGNKCYIRFVDKRYKKWYLFGYLKTFHIEEMQDARNGNP